MCEKIRIYNKKAFLLPDSINSCALFHAKIFPDGRYMFRVHDCSTGIRLIGTVTNPVDINEAIEKLEALSIGAKEFASFIKNEYADK